MENEVSDNRIILVCNNQGSVEQICLDTGSLLKDIELPIGLHSIVSPKSIVELGDFWLAIQEKSMEQNTVLTLSHNDQKITFKFSGYLLNDKVLFCGTTEASSTEKALEEIMRINSEQANRIRLTKKKEGNILKEDGAQEMNKAFLNDFSTLNNELINNKRELMRKNQKIELLNKELNAVNENMKMFTNSVSHDLKEPVRMIKSFLTMLNKRYGESLDQKGQQYLDMALDGANRLSNMMSDLLVYHQSSNLSTTETVDLKAVFSDVKQILQSEIAEKNAAVTSENLPAVKGSSTGFRKVFQNLISNAIKFVPEGRTPVVSVLVEEEPTNYTLMVKDNGVGIAEDQSQEVFNLFKRLNAPEQYAGTGMGLAMVRKSIERMGGEVWLESEVGEGSTFYFTIPKG